MNRYKVEFMEYGYAVIDTFALEDGETNALMYGSVVEKDCIKRATELNLEYLVTLHWRYM